MRKTFDIPTFIPTRKEDFRIEPILKGEEPALTEQLHILASIVRGEKTTYDSKVSFRDCKSVYIVIDNAGMDNVSPEIAIALLSKMELARELRYSEEQRTKAASAS